MARRAVTKSSELLAGTDPGMVKDLLDGCCHDPHHVLLRATRQEAAGGLMDVRRLADFLVGVQGRIRHRPLSRISPLAIPVMLEMGKEAVYGEADEALLNEAAEDLIAEAFGS